MKPTIKYDVLDCNGKVYFSNKNIEELSGIFHTETESLYIIIGGKGYIQGFDVVRHGGRVKQRRQIKGYGPPRQKVHDLETFLKETP